MQKPFSRDELMLTIRNVLQGKENRTWDGTLLAMQDRARRPAIALPIGKAMG